MEYNPIKVHDELRLGLVCRVDQSGTKGFEVLYVDCNSKNWNTTMRRLHGLEYLWCKVVQVIRRNNVIGAVGAGKGCIPAGLYGLERILNHFFFVARAKRLMRLGYWGCFRGGMTMKGKVVGATLQLTMSGVAVMMNLYSDCCTRQGFADVCLGGMGNEKF